MYLHIHVDMTHGFCTQFGLAVYKISAFPSPIHYSSVIKHSPESLAIILAAKVSCNTYREGSHGLIKMLYFAMPVFHC